MSLVRSLAAALGRITGEATHFELGSEMRAAVMSGRSFGWEAGPRSAAELKEAATHFERAAALHPAPEMKANAAGNAAWCRSQAETM